jgi:diadenosine tetraphosphatase ApaH/serine/threonine PP2A family protein phosphatase
MTLAVLSDIHGNIDALEAVLADLAPHAPAAIACLGDFVGYGAAPNPCVERLRPMIEVAVTGNHDVVASGALRLGAFNSDAATAARWTADALTPENRDWLRGLPFTATWRGALLVHASPLEPDQWHYVLSPHEAEEELSAFPEPLCLIGHSHVPGAFEQEGTRAPRYLRDAELALDPARRYIVNVGSVGQPRDGDPRAAYLLWDDAARTLRHVRVAYDVERAMARILDAGLPRFLAERLRWGE